MCTPWWTRSTMVPPMEQCRKATRATTSSGRSFQPRQLANLSNALGTRRPYHQHILELEGKRAKLLRTAEGASVDKVRRLLRLRGVGENSAWLYVMEFFGWRAFHNRREVGGLAGLVTTPFDSGAYPARRRFGNRLPPISLSPRVVFPHASGGGRSAPAACPTVSFGSTISLSHTTWPTISHSSPGLNSKRRIGPDRLSSTRDYVHVSRARRRATQSSRHTRS